jgi:hypothetical protein
MVFYRNLTLNAFARVSNPDSKTAALLDPSPPEPAATAQNKRPAQYSLSIFLL